MRLDGSTLIVTPDEARQITGIVMSGLLVNDPFGPSQVSEIRKLMGEPLWAEARRAPRVEKPNLLGLRVEVRP